MINSIPYTVQGPCGSFKTGRIYDTEQVIRYDAVAHQGVWQIKFEDASRGIYGTIEWNTGNRAVYADDFERHILRQYDAGNYR